MEYQNPTERFHRLTQDEVILLASFRRCSPTYREHVVCFAVTASKHSTEDLPENVIPFERAGK